MQKVNVNRVITTAQRGVTLLLTVLLLTAGIPTADAKPKAKSIDIIPTITDITLNSAGDLVASGTVAVQKNGKTKIIDFDDVPINLALADDQTGAGTCPILDLMLGPIDLNILGLVVETSEICLKITAVDGGGLLGDLLCDVAGLLQPGIPLNLDNLPLGDLDVLVAALTAVLNDALENLADAVIQEITEQKGKECAILNLELGPVDLTVLGLNVHLDDCDDGPVTVDITAVKGQLLGNLLCGLLKGKGLPIDVGSTLQDIIDGLLDELKPHGH
jgi:hypothetical protein